MSEPRERRLFLTGASGLLGRAIYAQFSSSNWEVYGTALSRVGASLHKLDLTDTVEVEKTVLEFKPSFFIHCAAQRFPDKVDSDPDAALNLNVIVTKKLAEICNAAGTPFLYISTDYVFNGESPPYTITEVPSPINMYGKTKLQGEEVALDVNKGNLVLRIPVIYGDVEYLGESAITVLMENLMNSSKPSKVSNYERRCPSNINDIAHICHKLAVKRLEDPNTSGIFHWCGKEMFTKYTMIIEMSDVFKLPHYHIEPTNEAPTSGTTRPYDTTLDTSRLEGLGIGQHTPFKEGIRAALEKWVKR